jgi:hypothetical protein
VVADCSFRGHASQAGCMGGRKALGLQVLQFYDNHTRANGSEFLNQVSRPRLSSRSQPAGSARAGDVACGPSWEFVAGLAALSREGSTCSDVPDLSLGTLDGTFALFSGCRLQCKSTIFGDGTARQIKTSTRRDTSWAQGVLDDVLDAIGAAIHEDYVGIDGTADIVVSEMGEFFLQVLRQGVKPLLQ